MAEETEEREDTGEMEETGETEIGEREETEAGKEAGREDMTLRCSQEKLLLSSISRKRLIYRYLAPLGKTLMGLR